MDRWNDQFVSSAQIMIDDATGLLSESPRNRAIATAADNSGDTERMVAAEMEGLNRHSRRLTLYGFSFVWLFFGGFAAWSALAPLDRAVVATGQVIVEGNRKTIQHETGGVIVEIRHRDGDKVEAGRVLIRMDDTRALANYEALLARFRELSAMQARLQAERDGLVEIAFPPILTEHADDPKVRAVMDGQINIFKSRKETLENKIAILGQQIETYKHEIAGLELAIAAKSDQLKLLAEEIQTVGELLQQGLAHKPRHLALRRQSAEIQGGKAENIANIARARQQIESAQLQILDLKYQLSDGVVTQLREVEATLSTTGEQLRSAKYLLDQTVVRAPQTGIVVGTNVHTVGGVVAPGAVMMQLVPIDNRLIVEAQIRPEDIEHVREGLPVHVRLLGFNRRVTPVVDGTLTYRSADALVDQVTKASYYLARAEVDLSTQADTANIELQPGMPVQVNIVTGQRTIVDYIVSPIMDGVSRAFREN